MQPLQTGVNTLGGTPVKPQAERSRSGEDQLRDDVDAMNPDVSPEVGGPNPKTLTLLWEMVTVRLAPRCTVQAQQVAAGLHPRQPLCRCVAVHSTTHHQMVYCVINSRVSFHLGPHVS